MNHFNNRHLLFLVLLCCITLLPSSSIAQTLSETLTDFNQDRIELNRNGMYLLSGWAITNMAVGSIGYFNSSGSTKYLHQMNVGWNLVNLAIAGTALYQYGQTHPAAFGLSQSISEAQSIEKILMLNIGLNVSYIAGGGYLWERGIRKSSNRLKGYGQSLIIQGGFLLLFDSTLYLLNRSNNQELLSIIEKISVQGTQLSISIPF
jgi:hypothetical protein